MRSGPGTILCPNSFPLVRPVSTCLIDHRLSGTAWLTVRSPKSLHTNSTYYSIITDNLLWFGAYYTFATERRYVEMQTFDSHSLFISRYLPCDSKNTLQSNSKLTSLNSCRRLKREKNSDKLQNSLTTATLISFNFVNERSKIMPRTEGLDLRKKADHGPNFPKTTKKCSARKDLRLSRYL